MTPLCAQVLSRVSVAGSPRTPILLGLAAAASFVATYGHTHLVAGATPPTRWFGLLSSPGDVQQSGALSVVAWLAVLALVGCWLALARRAVAGRLSSTAATLTAVLWSLPFLLGPPLSSLDVYSFACQGRQMVAGLSPYTVTPSQLPAGPLLAGTDPRWRQAPSPYGPVGLRYEWLAALLGHKDATATVVWLRVLAAVSIGIALILALVLSRPHRRSLTLVLLGMNPLLLINAVSAGHLEAPMLALLLGAVLAGKRRHPALALLLAVAAGLVKAPALIAVAFLVIHHLRNRETNRLRVIVRDAAVVLAAALSGTMLAPHGWGWISTVLRTPSIGRALWTPSTVAAELGAALLHWLDISVEFDQMLMVARFAGLALAAVILVALLSRTDEWETQLGRGLLSLCLLGFTLYPWYVLWGLPLIVIFGRINSAYAWATAAAVFTAACLWPETSAVAAVGKTLDHMVDSLGPIAGPLAIGLILQAIFAITRLLAARNPRLDASAIRAPTRWNSCARPGSRLPR